MTPLAELWRLQSRLSERLSALFAAEELYGLKLSAKVRSVVCAALVAMMILVLPPGRWAYWLVGILLLVGVSWLHYWLRVRWPRLRSLSYAVTLLDFSVLVVLAAQPDVLIERLVPIQAVNQLGAQRFIVLFIVLYAFTMRPALMLWAGAAAALSWGGLWIYLRSLPTSLSDLDQAWAGRSVILHPQFAGANRMLTDAVLFLVVAGSLAVVVLRLRGLVAQRAAIERERTNLSRYLPAQMADELAGRDSPFEEPQVREMAVAFVDMYGFTGRVAALSPKETIDFLRDFHRVLADCAFAHGAALEKFLGDGVMVTFGRLGARPQDAATALLCASAMVRAVAAWTAGRGDRPPVTIGIGIHYGPVVLGNIGSDQRVEAAVLGDVVNMASRIEALTRTQPQQILFSQAVHEAAAADPRGAALLVQSVFLGPQPLRGAKEPLPLYGLSVGP